MSLLNLESVAKCTRRAPHRLVGVLGGGAAMPHATANKMRVPQRGLNFSVLDWITAGLQHDRYGERAPLGAQAQQPGKLRTIGFLGSVSVPAAQGGWVTAFLQRLRELGWIEGRNFVIEYRWAEGSSDRAADFAVEFVRLKVDIIVTYATPVVLAA